MTDGEIIKKVVLFMANRWTKEVAHEIYGTVMGDHFWGKWRGTCEKYGPDYATMRLFYEMTEDNLDKLAGYALR